MLLEIIPERISGRKIQQIADCLENGGIIIYPTDTVYGIGCDIFNKKAVERVCKLKGIDPKKANLTFICKDISEITNYSLPISNSVFKLMKSTLPGPFTYILKANSSVPKLFRNNKKTIGVRIPNDPVAEAIIERLGRPLLSTSLKQDDDFIEYPNDPLEMYDAYGKLVDMVIDGGLGGLVPSTVIDCTAEPTIVRQGLGEIYL